MTRLSTARIIVVVSLIVLLSRSGEPLLSVQQSGDPSAPANLQASTTGGVVTLAWTAPTSGGPVIEYVVDAGSSSQQSNLYSAAVGLTTTLSAPAPPGTYFVRVRARRTSGLSGPSNEVTVVVGGPGPCAALSPPTMLTHSVAGQLVQLSWPTVNGATGYVVEAGSQAASSNLAVVETPSNALSASAGNGTYFVRVRAKNACSLSGPSNEVIVIVGSSTPPNDGVTRFQDGPRTAYLERDNVRVGIDKDWGAAISEIWYAGNNLVNNYNGGRLAGVSLYDGLDPYVRFDDPSWGWNPTPSDKYDHTNRPLTYSFSNGVLYTAVRNLHWNPDNRGGGRQTAVPSDVYVETWTELLSGGVVHLRFRLTHDGADTHTTTLQELPFAYVRTPYSRVVYYAGSRPWTNDAVTLRSASLSPSGENVSASERWAGLVNGSDVGLVLWAPQAYQRFYSWFFNAVGPEDATFYLVPTTVLGIGPGFVHESEAYLFAGRWQDARARIYTVQSSRAFADVFPPHGYLDQPAVNATISGVVQVAGWVADESGTVARVDVVMDGRVVGQATHGITRPDVASDWPGVPGALNSGYAYRLDTRTLSNGAHFIEVRAVDAAGNSAVLVARKAIVVQN